MCSMTARTGHWSFSGARSTSRAPTPASALRWSATPSPPGPAVVSARGLRPAGRRASREAGAGGWEVRRLRPDARLPGRPRAPARERLEVGGPAARAELVDDVIGKLEEL